MESMMSPADMRAVMDGDGRDGMDGSWWIIILFLFLFGSNGFGGRNDALTRAEMQDGFNYNQLESAIRGVQSGLCDGFYAQNTTMLQGFNGVQRDLCQGFAAVNAGINENRFAAQQCCCETNRNIDAVRFEASKNTCDITNAIHAEGEATRALINSNEMQRLRDELQSANFQLSQQAQNAYLINEIRPCAKPAYITCSPYTTNGCNCA